MTHIRKILCCYRRWIPCSFGHEFRSNSLRRSAHDIPVIRLLKHKIYEHVVRREPHVRLNVSVTSQILIRVVARQQRICGKS